MQKLLLSIILAICLNSCAGKHYMKSTPSQIPISRTVKLNTDNVWPLTIQGTFLQQITCTAMGKQQSFSVHLTLEDMMLEAIAFNDVAGRLYSLHWTPWNVDWEGSKYIPSVIKPENILLDFLLVHLPAHQLRRVLKGADVYENDNNNGKTRIIQGSNVKRTIYYSKPMGAMWGHVIIENPLIGYKLEIQTVSQ